MAPSSAPPVEPPKPTPPPLWRRTWPWIALAFIVGLVLFVVAIRPQQHGGFFRAGDVPPAASEPGYSPLPAPMAGEAGSGIGSLEPPPAVEAPVARQPVERPAPAAAPVERPASEPRAPAVADRKPRPLPGRTPPPNYPSGALRDGTTGTVLVLVHIGPDGVPTSTEIAQSSGSRDLDRAAAQAVRRWQFEPAIADGHPTVGDVVVPIDFKLTE
ncbi:energy transducer TonB [Cognatilysobacter segetis]|uniref:energy transducer TonB n=1 Tax=Cognatilysobacter segetis TaxID=2492394 RepID=UPI00138FF454|nr:energy transducer TonB [Lysobacter segetis]